MDIRSCTKFNDIDINTLLSFIAEGLVMFDKEGYITTLNPHASLLLDYTTDELIGKKFDDIVPIFFDDKKVEGESRIASSVLNGEIFIVPDSETLYFETNNGKRFPVFASAKPMQFSDDKDTKGGVLVFRDITTEKELEQYRENTAKTLSELTPVLQKTSTGDFTCFPNLPKEENEFTELLVGLRLMLDDLKELDLAREKNERDKIDALEEKRVLTEKYSKELENEVEKKTKQVSDAKKHIETVIESLTSGLIEYDDEYRVVRLNKAAEDILGIKEEYIVGKDIQKEDIDVKSLSSVTAVTYPDLVEGMKIISPEISGIDAEVFEITTKYPIERDLQVAAVSVSGVGREGGEGTLKIVRDITREKLISRSKSEFISIAAHQLRTPLSAVKWSLDLLLKGEFGNLENDQLKVIADAFDTNEKMVGLVNDLLNVARIEDGRFGYEFQKGNFHYFISQIFSQSEKAAKEKNIEMTFSDHLNGPLELLFDQSKMSVAIQNLIDNAIKYTPFGGKIEVVVSRENEFIKIEVKDTGVGIPPHQVERLFTKFFRAENVLRLPVSGSGLGLFIARNIISRHGGTIQAMPNEGGGTVFALTLPVDESLIPERDDIAASLYV